jgi:putative ABC transport system substrate-binding protein
MSQVRRRRFLIALGALFAAPLTSFAQPAQKVRRIGFLGVGVAKGAGAMLARQRLTDTLRRLGYDEGRNLVVEWRYAENKPERFPALVDELIRSDLELIVTITGPVTLAAKRATRTIPIVMISILPLAYGLIDSYARPGGNITGVDSFPTAELSLKNYQILKDAVPGAKRAVRLLYPRPLFDPIAFERQLGVAEKTGLAIAHVEMTRAEELTASLEKIVASRPDVLFVSGDEFFIPHFAAIAEFAVKRKLVSISESPGYTLAGGLLNYSSDSLANLDRVASFIDRILRGARPGDLPVEQPTQYELVLNRKTAKALGVKLPLSFMRQVTRVIE